MDPYIKQKYFKIKRIVLASFRNRYLLPIQKDEVQKIQIPPPGRFAHENFRHCSYAQDLRSPIGSNVLCSRDGIVLHIKQDSEVHGMDPSFANFANYIQILHDDGEISEYIHLQKNSVTVSYRERVYAGQVIAKTGWSGCMNVPHLHFNVCKLVGESGGKKAVGLPFFFK